MSAAPSVSAAEAISLQHPATHQSVTSRSATLIALSALQPSNRNVRTTPPSGIEALAESIARTGLLQNLVVMRSDRGRRHEVVAGQRRLAALRLLAEARRIAKDHPVPCLVIGKDGARSASLTENVHREAMHPANEFDAFAALVSEGRSIEDIAAAFGVAPVVVQRRLRLSRVSPRLIAGYRAGELTLDQLMALAIVEDPAAQESAFYSAPDWQRSARELRRRLTFGDIRSDDPRVLLVGLDAYRTAGGGIREDLFAQDQATVQLTDPDLIERLAGEQLRAAADRIKADGWLWVEVLPTFSFEATRGLTEVQPSPRSPSDTEAQAMQRRVDLLAAAEAALRDAEEGDVAEADTSRLEDAVERAENDIRDARNVLREYVPAVKAVAGGFVSVDRKGRIETRMGYVRKEHLGALRSLEAQRPDSEGAADNSDRHATAVPTPGLPASLGYRLSAWRTAALQSEVAARPQIALALLVDRLADRVIFGGSAHVPESIGIRIDVPAGLESADEALKTSEVRSAFLKLRDHWQLRLPAQREERLEALLALPESELFSLLAICVGASIDALEPQPMPKRRATAIEEAVGLDMSRYWTATATSFFNHLPKAAIVDTVKAFAPEQANRLMPMKKAAMAAEAELLARGTGWLPPAFRRAPRSHREDIGRVASVTSDDVVGEAQSVARDTTCDAEEVSDVDETDAPPAAESPAARRVSLGEVQAPMPPLAEASTDRRPVPAIGLRTR